MGQLSEICDGPSIISESIQKRITGEKGRETAKSFI